MQKVQIMFKPESEQIKVHTLNGIEDWGNSKFIMRILLLSHDAYNVVTGKDKKPEEPPVEATEAIKTAYEANLEKWNKKDTNY